MTEEKPDGSAPFDGVISQDELQGIPWRMLFPIPLPPLSNHPHLLATASADVITRPEQAAGVPGQTESALINHPVDSSADSLEGKP